MIKATYDNENLDVSPIHIYVSRFQSHYLFYFLQPNSKFSVLICIFITVGFYFLAALVYHRNSLWPLTQRKILCILKSG